MASYEVLSNLVIKETEGMIINTYLPVLNYQTSPQNAIVSKGSLMVYTNPTGAGVRSPKDPTLETRREEAQPDPLRA